jgi:hypothetical protein
VTRKPVSTLKCWRGGSAPHFHYGFRYPSVHELKNLRVQKAISPVRALPNTRLPFKSRGSMWRVWKMTLVRHYEQSLGHTRTYKVVRFLVPVRDPCICCFRTDSGRQREQHGAPCALPASYWRSHRATITCTSEYTRRSNPK